MKPKIIHQLVAGFRRGDAISNEACLMRGIFRDWGVKSDILCEARRISGDAVREVRSLAEASLELGRDDIAILHLSIGCQINLAFRELPCRKVILYHNVTPASYFRYLNPVIAADLAEGRRHLESLADSAELSLADSAYNASELVAAGYRNVSVFPFAFDVNSFGSGVCDARTMVRLGDGRLNVLFVGRCVPNKKIEDLVTAMYYLNRIEPEARLVHVGSTVGAETYYGLLRAQAKVLELRNVLFMNAVEPEVLNACYASAHAFLCLSEHEGFCVPLIEAMIRRVPIFALSSSAVPETLGGAGTLFSAPPNFSEIAETISRVSRDASLRSAILARQDRRLEDFRLRDIAFELRAALAPFL